MPLRVSTADAATPPEKTRRRSCFPSRARRLVRLLVAYGAFAEVTLAEEIAEERFSEPPLVLGAAYTADLWSNMSGGLATGERYLDNLDLTLEADMGALAGWEGARFFLYGLYNNGASLNELTGDAQVISNIETGVSAFRLYEAWVEQPLWDGASVKLGLYDLNSEFDALETSSLFLGSAHGIGTDISQTGLNGPSIFPVTSLALRFETQVSPHVKIRTVLLDGAPGDPDHPARTTVKLSGGDGALSVSEVDWAFPRGRLLAGYWRYTAEFETWDGAFSTGNDGYYLRAEALLLHHPKENRGLEGFFRLGSADGAFNMFSRFASAGLVYTGPLQARPEDKLGIAAAVAFAGDEFRLMNPWAEAAEIALELTYSADVAPWLQVQPNLQYTFHPSLDPETDNVFALGLRFMLHHEWK